jgi:two-component system cell cycle sensor histidine kinase/response regulator CckA
MFSSSSHTALRGNETVLLVEPEPETRALAAFMLSKQGYRVIEAHNAMEAVKIYDESEDSIDLLLVEALMSRINGHELADMLHQKNPFLRVLFLADSDYLRLIARVAERKGLHTLCRPFTMKMLAENVRQVLDAPAPNDRTAAAGGFGE